jgi:uncharacterized membrane protein YeaQ/YmgE (transglycosylase-associated protein family)
MDITSLIIFLVVGLIAGWLAGQLVKGGSFGLIGDIIVGVIGALIGGFLLPKVGVGSLVANAFINSVIVATIGAVILLLVLKLLRR